jgi:glucan phosphorylase
MEFMLSEALPIYSGGLGNVAGDQFKGASDLGVPVTGVGLLWQQGYFRQLIDASGAQQAIYSYNDPGQLPITPVREPNNEWLRLHIALYAEERDAASLVRQEMAREDQGLGSGNLHRYVAYILWQR